MAKSQLPPVETIRQLLTYDSESGRLFWKLRGKPIWDGRYAGREAATSLNDQGYKQVQLLGVTSRAHILAWAIHHGEIPPEDIDHINGDRADNRIVNLRLATRSQNLCNKRRDRRGSVPFRGVSKGKAGRFQAHIKLNRKSKYLGTFDRAEDAARAYDDEARRMHGDFAVLNFPDGWPRAA